MAAFSMAVLGLSLKPEDNDSDGHEIGYVEYHSVFYDLAYKVRQMLHSN